MIWVMLVLSASSVVVFGAPAGTPTSDGSVFVKPNIMDAARDVVKASSMPDTLQNGAWVNANPGGVNGNPGSIPKNASLVTGNGLIIPVGNETSSVSAQPGSSVNGELPALNATQGPLLVAERGKPGSLVAAGADAELVAFSNSSTTESSAILATNATEASSTVEAVSAGTVSAVVIPVRVAAVAVAPVAVLAENASARVVREASDSTAFVSSKLDNVVANQTFPVSSNQAIVAVLPAGTNLSATWNASASGTAPAVILPQTSEGLPSATQFLLDHVALTAELTTELTTDSTTESTTTSAVPAVAVPVVVIINTSGSDSSSGVALDATHESFSSNVTTASDASASSNHNAAVTVVGAGESSSGTAGVLVVLPGKTNNITSSDLATIPGALPVALVNSTSGNTSDSARVARSADSTAIVSSEINNVKDTRTIPVNSNNSIIAVLPAGANLSATWNASQNSGPAVIINSPLSGGQAEAESTTAASTSTESSTTTTEPTTTTTTESTTESTSTSGTIAVPIWVIINSSGNASAADNLESSTTTEATTTIKDVLVPVVVPVIVDAVNVTRAKRAPEDNEDSTAVISSKVNNVELNKTLAINGEKPVIAILPPGSNLTATWNNTAGSSPPVILAPLASEKVAVTTEIPTTVSVASSHLVAVPGVLLLNKNQSVHTESVHIKAANAVVVAVSTTVTPVSSANNGDVMVPVILPAGTHDLDNKDLSSIPGVKPIAIVATPVGNGDSNTVAQVPAHHSDTDAVVIQQNHRLEVQLTGYEVTNPSGPVNQNLGVWVRFTAGALPPVLVVKGEQEGKDQTPIQANNPTLVAPESTTGYVSVFNGSYSSKVSYSQTLTADLCGQVSDKGILDVIVKPNGADAGNFQTLHYSCALNLNFQTAARYTEAFWSDEQHCNSASAQNGYSQKITYKIRNYNINWHECQQNRPGVAVA